MQIQAIYRRGRLEFLQPIEVDQDDIPVTVTFPEGIVVRQPVIPAPAGAADRTMREAIRKVLAPVHDQLSGAGKHETQATPARDIWHRHLEEKYLERK